MHSYVNDYEFIEGQSEYQTYTATEVGRSIRSIEKRGTASAIMRTNDTTMWPV